MIPHIQSFLSFLIFLSGCSSESHNVVNDASGNAAATEVRILFVGNSLTYANNLPALVAEIAAHDSVKIIYSMMANSNYSLGDHLDEGKVQSEIGKGIYDFVVVQQGPSALPESQVLLLQYAKQFAGLCSATTKSKLAFYTVWPSLARTFDHDNVIYSYANAAQSTNSLLCPAGLAWKIAWGIDPSLPFYSADEFHPGIHGSVLAALTIYGSLMKKKDFTFLEKSGMSWNAEISDQQFETMKSAALQSYMK